MSAPSSSSFVASAGVTALPPPVCLTSTPKPPPKPLTDDDLLYFRLFYQAISQLTPAPHFNVMSIREFCGVIKARPLVYNKEFSKIETLALGGLTGFHKGISCFTQLRTLVLYKTQLSAAPIFLNSLRTLQTIYCIECTIPKSMLLTNFKIVNLGSNTAAWPKGIAKQIETMKEIVASMEKFEDESRAIRNIALELDGVSNDST